MISCPKSLLELKHGEVVAILASDILTVQVEAVATAVGAEWCVGFVTSRALLVRFSFQHTAIVVIAITPVPAVGILH